MCLATSKSIFFIIFSLVMTTATVIIWLFDDSLLATSSQMVRKRRHKKKRTNQIVVIVALVYKVWEQISASNEENTPKAIFSRKIRYETKARRQKQFPTLKKWMSDSMSEKEFLVWNSIFALWEIQRSQIKIPHNP